jgi:hypothetical protein
MLVCESGRGVAIAAVAFSLAVGKPSVFLLISVVIVEEVLEVFSTLADRRCARDLVPQAWASSAQVDIETRAHVVVLVGRPLGVFLFSLTPILPFLADATSFVVSVLSIVNLKTRRTISTRIQRVSGRRLGKDIGAAWTVLLNDKYARVALTLSAGTTLIGQALIMVFLAGARTSGLSSGWEGLVLAASGVGGVLGAVSAPRFRMRPKSSVVLLQIVAWVAALVSLAGWGYRSFLWMAVVMAILSLTGALGNIEIDTHLFRSFDENMLARVTSFGRLIAYSASAVGPMLGGILVQFYGTRIAVLALAAFTAILATLAFCTPSMRNYRAVMPPPIPLLQRLQEIVTYALDAITAVLATGACVGVGELPLTSTGATHTVLLTSGEVADFAPLHVGVSSRTGTAKRVTVHVMAASHPLTAYLTSHQRVVSPSITLQAPRRTLQVYPLAEPLSEDDVPQGKVVKVTHTVPALGPFRLDAADGTGAPKIEAPVGEPARHAAEVVLGTVDDAADERIHHVPQNVLVG